jgi:predicted permease
MDDIRLALRTLRTSPIVSAVAVLSLALGIGANTAIFSVVNALLLRSLPVVEPDRLVTVSSGFAINHGFRAGAGMNYDMWMRMREHLGAFDDGFAWAPGRVDLSPGGERQPAEALFTSGRFLATLGVPALIGRILDDGDDGRGGGRDGLVAVIGYGLWQRRFGGSASVLGAALPIDGVPCTIVGVMPPDFFGIEVGQPFDLILPLGIEPDVRGARASLHHPSALLLTVMLRLKRGQSIDSATAALRTFQSEIVGLNGKQPPRVPEFLKDPYVLVPAATGTSDRSGLRRQYSRPLMTVLAVVVLVLLVACVNIANLFLARATARSHEMSVRLALGATRWRLGRQLLVESLVVALAGAACGLLFATWASRAVVASLSTVDTRVSLDLSLDWRVLAVTAGIAVATAILFGTGPALRAARAAPIDAMKEQGRTAGSRRDLSTGLVVGQMAVSLVLLVCAGLFLSTFTRLAALPLGFDPARVLVVNVDTARVGVDASARIDYFRQLVSTVQTVPGVARAAGSMITPFSQATKSPLFSEPGRVHQHAVSPGFFDVYGIDIRSGRDFDERDTTSSPRVVVVSESYARKFLADRDPLGATIDSGPCAGPQGRCAIVGVVSEAVFAPPRAGARPTMYVPLSQSAGMAPPGRTEISISVRSATGSPALLARGVTAALTAVDRNLAFSYRPLIQDVRASLTQERMVAWVSGFFGVLALLLSSLGLYGVTAYAVTRRRREIGVRVALGATPASVILLLLTRVFVVVLAGLAVGVPVALWTGRLVAALLYGVDSRNLATIGVAGLTLCSVAIVASLIAAFRATRIEPAEVLRQG